MTIKTSGKYPTNNKEEKRLSINAPQAPHDDDGGAAAAHSGFDWQKWLPWIIGAVGLVAVVGAFFWGQSNGTDQYKKGSKEYNKIYQAGQTAGDNAGQAYGMKVGEQEGKKAGEAAGYKAGSAHGYAVGQKDGYENGKANGLKAGTQAGEAKGIAQGRAQGVAWGAKNALGGYGSWNPAVPYIVDINNTTAPGVPFQVGARLLMKQGRAYYLCTTSTNGLCSMAYPGP